MAEKTLNADMIHNEISMLFDASLCSGCKGCQTICKSWNQLPSPLDSRELAFSSTWENPLVNDGDTWLHMKFSEIEDSKGKVAVAITRNACMHCKDAACVKACPTGACHYEKNGSVVIDQAKCIGCKYCAAACPFEIPKYRERTSSTCKCWFCQDRLANDRTPACVGTCPTGALYFGLRKEVVKMAQDRLAQIKPDYPDAIIYGLDGAEMGGTHLLMILPYGAKVHQMPVNPKPNVMTQAGKVVPVIAGLGFVGVLGVTALSLLGGRGASHTIDTYSYDEKTGVTYEDEGQGRHERVYDGDVLVSHHESTDDVKVSVSRKEDH